MSSRGALCGIDVSVSITLSRVRRESMSVWFQPVFTYDFAHSARTVFDRRANVRARVRFRLQGGQPVALLDDLHKLNAQLTGRGNYQGVWDLPFGAPYVDGKGLHKQVGGLKIWRDPDQFRIYFYGPRNLGCKGPREYDVHVSVQVTGATQYNPDSWMISDEAGGEEAGE